MISGMMVSSPSQSECAEPLRLPLHLEEAVRRDGLVLAEERVKQADRRKHRDVRPTSWRNDQTGPGGAGFGMPFVS